MTKKTIVDKAREFIERTFGKTEVDIVPAGYGAYYVSCDNSEEIVSVLRRVFPNTEWIAD